jgi:PPOX class probable F420-dependent enzyme
MAQSTTATAAPSLVPAARELLLDGLRFATIATLNANGSPHQAVVWYRIDGDDLVVNSADGRVWPANLRRDPRVSLTIEDGYRWLSIRGTVTVVDARGPAQADIAEMARRYHADEPERAEAMIRDRFELQQRVSFRLPLATSKTYYHED